MHLSFLPGPEVAPFRLGPSSASAAVDDALLSLGFAPDAQGVNLSALGLELADLPPKFSADHSQGLGSQFLPASQEQAQNEAALLQSTIAALFGSYPGGAAASLPTAPGEDAPQSSQNTQDVFAEFLQGDLELYERDASVDAHGFSNPSANALPTGVTHPAASGGAGRHATVTTLDAPRPPLALPTDSVLHLQHQHQHRPPHPAQDNALLSPAELSELLSGSPQESPTVVDGLGLLFSPEVAVNPMVLHQHHHQHQHQHHQQAVPSPQDYQEEGMRTTRASARAHRQQAHVEPPLPSPHAQAQQGSAASSPLTEAPPSPYTPTSGARPVRPLPSRARPSPAAQLASSSRIIPYTAPVQPRHYQSDSLTARKRAQANVLERVDPRLREGVKRVLEGRGVWSQTTEEGDVEPEVQAGEEEQEDRELELDEEEEESEEEERPRKKQKGKAASSSTTRAASRPAAAVVASGSRTRTPKPPPQERKALESEILLAASSTLVKAGDKRWKNTMSQRRSREKKRQELEEMRRERDEAREEVERLRGENEQLRQQVVEMFMAGMGQQGVLQ